LALQQQQQQQPNSMDQMMKPSSQKPNPTSNANNNSSIVHTPPSTPSSNKKYKEILTKALQLNLILKMLLLLRYFMNEDFQLNVANPSLNPYTTTTNAVKSSSSFTNQAGSGGYLNLIKSHSTTTTTSPPTATKLGGGGGSTANAINTIEMNMLDIILNEIDACVDSKEAADRLKQLVSQMHVYFSDKLSDLAVAKNKLASEFEEVKLKTYFLSLNENLL
jgi:hypothetical protein